MEKEKNIFTLIVKSSIFVFLKEKYPDYKINDKDDDNNIEKIYKLLKKLEKYGYIPDKKKIIKEDYKIIKSYLVNESFSEEKFLNTIENESKNLSNDEKNYILNAVIFVSNEDGKISDDEKEFIIQIARALDINHNYKKILSNYNKSEFKAKSSSIPLMISIGVLVLLVIITIGIFYKIEKTSQLQIFKTNNYQFDKMHFNRYIIYKNMFQVKTKKFKKYAVYYISGTAQIGFNPQNLKYNPITKTITLSQNNFNITLSISPKNQLEIDKVNPKEITKGEARSLGAVVGLTSAYMGASAGAKIGSSLANFLPKKYSFIVGSAAGLAGGLLAGGAGYFITTDALTGAKLSSDISLAEKEKVLKVGVALIKTQLQTNKKLQDMYKKDFETFIRAKYKTLGIDVQRIEYEKD